MRDRVEVALQVRVIHFPLPSPKVRANRIEGVVSTSARPKPERTVTKVRFEDRFQNQQHGHLDDSVADRRDAQRTHATVGLGDLYAANRIRLVALVPQVCLELLQKTSHAIFGFFDVYKRDTINSGGGLGLPYATPSRLQNIHPVDSIVQGVKSKLRFLLRFLIQLHSQTRDFRRQIGSTAGVDGVGFVFRSGHF